MLAVTGLERTPLLPDVPAMAEFVPVFDIASWQGLPPRPARRRRSSRR